MLYGAIPLIVSILLALRHVALPDAPRWSKVLMSVAVGGSLIVWFRYPRWILLATLVQVGASIYMLVYSRLQPGTGR